MLHFVLCVQVAAIFVPLIHFIATTRKIPLGIVNLVTLIGHMTAYNIQAQETLVMLFQNPGTPLHIVVDGLAIPSQPAALASLLCADRYFGI